MSATPASTLSRSGSSSSVSLTEHSDSECDGTPSTSTSSSPRSRSPVPVPRAPRSDRKNGFLAAPNPQNRTLSRSPSPLGLIPIHRTFSKFIHKHEVPRKVLHVSIGFLAIYLYHTGHQPSRIVPPLTSLLVPVASADLLRFYSQDFNALYIKVLGALMRESEVRGWNGVVWYLVGTIAVLAIFPKDVATLSIVLLSWCDTAASTFGRLWGRYTPAIRRGKSLAGSLAAAIVGALSAGLFWGLLIQGVENDGIMWKGRLAIAGVEVAGGWALTAMSVMTGIVAATSEVIDAWGLDDNVVIPIVSAAGIWGLLKLFG